jgi:hypothetical protein
MSLSGSSDSRWSSCAITTFAIWSSTGVPRKTMRSFPEAGPTRSKGTTGEGPPDVGDVIGRKGLRRPQQDVAHRRRIPLLAALTSRDLPLVQLVGDRAKRKPSSTQPLNAPHHRRRDCRRTAEPNAGRLLCLTVPAVKGVKTLFSALFGAESSLDTVQALVSSQRATSVWGGLVSGADAGLLFLLRRPRSAIRSKPGPEAVRGPPQG